MSANNHQKTWKRAAAAGAFIAVFILLFQLIGQIFIFKDTNSYNSIRSFYKIAPQTVDVAFIGSCHVHYNINPMQLWDQYGMAACNLTNSNQTFEVAVLALKECLKTQSPRLVVLDLLAAAYDDTYIYDGGIGDYIQENMDAYHFSLDKVKAAFQLRRYGNPFEYVFGLFYHKARYADLSKADFTDTVDASTRDYQYKPNQGIENVVSTYSEQAATARDFDANEKKSLLEFIRICKQNGIELLFVSAPYQLKEGEMGFYKTCREIADENGISFLNFNSVEQQLSFTPQSFSEAYHLNVSGVKQYTAYLGAYIANHDQIPDQRENPLYDTWRQDSLRAKQIVQSYALDDARNLSDFLAVLNENRNDYVTCVNVYSCGIEDLSEGDIEQLQELGIDPPPYLDSYAAVTDGGQATAEHTSDTPAQVNYSLGDMSFFVKSVGYNCWSLSDEFSASDTVIKIDHFEGKDDASVVAKQSDRQESETDNTEIRIPKGGLHFVVFDKALGKVVYNDVWSSSEK